MQASAALAPIDSRYTKGLRDLIACIMLKSPGDRPSVENIMAFPVVVNALMNLCTDIGRLPCTRCATCTMYIHVRFCDVEGGFCQERIRGRARGGAREE